MRIFGLDLGTTSIGFAVIDHDEARHTGNILRLGVRIFPEARDPDGTPLNQQRRAKRMMRRQLRRRRQRRRSLNELLTEHGLLPAYGTVEWARVMNGDPEESDPYVLRSRGLSERLEPYQLGRALYHLSKRRQFKERDIAETGEDKTGPESGEERAGKKRGKANPAVEAGESADEAKATEERAHFVAALKASGRTIGEALASRGPSGPLRGGPPAERKRGEHATRAIVEDEFNRLLQAQAPHHSPLRDPAMRGALHEAIFAQRPVFWRKSTLGACRFFPGAALCPKGSWLSQQRVMLEKVNNLAIAGGNARPLDSAERAAILAALSTQKSMGWPGVRGALEPLFKVRGESTKYIRFNLEYGDEKGGLKGNVVEADLAKVFGDAWGDHPHKEALREFLPRALWEADYAEIGTQRVVIRPEAERAIRRSALTGRLREDFGASATQAAALTRLHFPQGWEPFSTRALEVILPKLAEGTRFGALLADPLLETWRNECFPDRQRPTGEVIDRLPSAYVGKPRKLKQQAGAAVVEARRAEAAEEADRIRAIRNPTVLRVQNELRKVVNNLIGLYGKPDLIRIELARQIGKSKREREEISAAIRRNEAKRKTALKDLEDNKIANPAAHIEKWLLWQECGKQCPYSGKDICFDALFRDNPQFQIEHIWPRSKSLDDSFRNKTLCDIALNQDKGDRTPFDYFKTRLAEHWDEVKLRLDKMVKGKLWSPGKAKRFLAEKIEDDFAARQLNDTSYAARQAMAFLRRLWPDVGASAPVNVQAVTGKVTAQLRRRWGLNNILADDGEKTRADHRHHAIDALVVACAHGGYTQKLSHYLELDDAFRRGQGVKPDPAEVPPPWPTIRADAQAAVDAIVVSHRVQKKVSGPLHKDTTYGDTRRDVISGRIKYRAIVGRVPITALSIEDVMAEDLAKSKFVIADAAVRKALRLHIATFGGDIKKAFAERPTLGVGGPPIKKVRLLSKRQIDGLEAIGNGLGDPEAKHHVAIFRLPDGSYDSDVVTLFCAARRLSSGLPVVDKRNRTGQFVMTLAKGDTIEMIEARSKYWVVRELKANRQITLVPHTEARATKQAAPFKPTLSGLMKLAPRKLSIDPIGRVRPAHD